mmetsp:Transcript_38596/g.36944  ORF Transcript_38596/g.36944 Transcript_38596/m.36944 type:complete len:128 (-) Transcript_38596:358-741(-)
MASLMRMAYLNPTLYPITKHFYIPVYSEIHNELITQHRPRFNELFKRKKQTYTFEDYNEWQPPFERKAILKEAFFEVPGDEGSSTFLSRFLEGPSMLKLCGQAFIWDHDCIHIITGRGLHRQDEAWV